MFERKHQKVAPLPVFIGRMLLFVGMALLLIFGALAIGVGGYHWWAGYGWIDSLLNASMILGGMGQVDPLTTDAGKLFASAYALFSGVVFIAVMGMLFTPVVHRILHKFHIGEEDLNTAQEESPNAERKDRTRPEKRTDRDRR